MNVFKSFVAIFVLFFFALAPALTTPSLGEDKPRTSVTEKVKDRDATRHRLTGTVLKVDRNEGVVHVKGRRGERSFMVTPDMASKVSLGERVRVYYLTTPDKKVVVKRIKKINNGEEVTDGERGRKGRDTRDQ
ncbi:MAG: hypothetical protein GTN70_08460 [Deltaproteobacteria bacterium]|nr:hypothetical protein [Deltaproteobacteria bacterium]NIS77797.1 hypothetical protein [Deltaproteobacteria bacterium]